MNSDLPDNKDWLSLEDLDEIKKKCKHDLESINWEVAEQRLPQPVRQRFIEYLNNIATITEEGETAVSCRLKSNRQKDDQKVVIIPFAHFRAYAALRPLILALDKYQEAAKILKKHLQEAYKGATPKDLYKKIYDGEITKDEIEKYWEKMAPDNLENCEMFYQSIKKNQHGKNGIFRNDSIPSTCAGVLNLYVERTGFNTYILEFIRKTADPLEELTDITLNTSVAELQSDKTRNIIFYGAPGTGKSYRAEKFFGCKEKHLHRVVFFADYQNSDFIGSVRPVMQKNEDGSSSVSYEFEKGPFTLALEDAKEHPSEAVVLLIEEINRGNAASIFGEIFQLLDRDSNGASKYQVKIPKSLSAALTDTVQQNGSIRLPANLFIVATMNNSDQGVFPMDTAFKRRFSFEYLPIDFESKRTDPDFSTPRITIENTQYSWIEFAKSMNKLLLKGASIAEDKLLGPYFLSPAELQSEALDEFITQKVLIYIWEDVLRHGDRRVIFDLDSFNSFSELQERISNQQNVYSSRFLDEIEKTSSKRLESESEESQNPVIDDA